MCAGCVHGMSSVQGGLLCMSRAQWCGSSVIVALGSSACGACGAY